MITRPQRSTLFPYTTLFRSNTDLSLLLYVRKLLAKSGISTSIPRVTHRAGSILKDPHTGRTYKRRKDSYRSEEHTSELQSHSDLVCRLLLEKKKTEERIR